VGTIKPWYTGNQLASSEGGEEGGCREGVVAGERRGRSSALRPAPCPLPGHSCPVRVRAGGCPADGLRCWSTAQRGKAPVQRAEELACSRAGKVPASHSTALEHELGPLCSLPPRESALRQHHGHQPRDPRCQRAGKWRCRR